MNGRAEPPSRTSSASASFARSLPIGAPSSSSSVLVTASRTSEGCPFKNSGSE